MMVEWRNSVLIYDFFRLTMHCVDKISHAYLLVIVLSLCNVVATGFPAGQTPLAARLEEIKFAVSCGALEIDIVVNRQFALCGSWKGMDKIRFGAF